LDAAALLRRALEPLGGRGGGRPAFAQGAVPPEQVHDALASLRAEVHRVLCQTIVYPVFPVFPVYPVSVRFVREVDCEDWGDCVELRWRCLSFHSSRYWSRIWPARLRVTQLCRCACPVRPS